VNQALDLLALEPIRVDLGEQHRDLPVEELALPIRRAWLERGLPLPALTWGHNSQLGPEQISISLYGQEESHLDRPEGDPGEALQWELARVVAGSLKRILHRDFVRVLAEDNGLTLPAQQLGRLSKYFRCRLQAGLSLPPVGVWLQLSENAPFDDIGLVAEPLAFRSALSQEIRKQSLWEAVPDECRETFAPYLAGAEASVSTWDQLQAVEELLGARDSLAFPGLELARRWLTEADPSSVGRRLGKAFFFHNALKEYQEACRQEPFQVMQLLLRPPVRSLPILGKIALWVQSVGSRPLRQYLESRLGKLAAVEASPDQVQRVLQDSLRVL
jgi:hypothetical protein